MNTDLQTQYNRVSTNIANTYTAISNKGGTLPQTQNSANLASAIETIPTGINIQGVIESYKVYAGSNVNAGDFVKYLNAEVTGSDTYLYSNKDKISAVKLDENSVFIAIGYSSDLYGLVCTISGTTITQGSVRSIASRHSEGDVFSVTALSSTSVFIAHRYRYSSSVQYRLYGIVCTISGTSITKGTDTSIISGSTKTSQVISTVALSDTSVFIAYSLNSVSGNQDYTLMGIVCSITSGGSIYPRYYYSIIFWYYILHRKCNINNSFIKHISFYSS